MNNKEITFIDAYLTGDYSGAIERSEERGQQSIVKNKRLPIKSNNHTVPREVRYAGITDEMEYEEYSIIEAENNKKWTKEQYESMGIKIIDEYDKLFYNVTLPAGWDVKPTTHTMWNDVVDHKGRKRISFFYKAAYYDEEAFSNFEKRYTYSQIPFDNYETDATYDERQAKEWYGVVYDCGKEIFKTEGYIKKDYFDETLNHRCLQYLTENYPLWKDFKAYWND